MTPALNPAAMMADAGVIQEGDSRLTVPVRPFSLPDEADSAHDLIVALNETAERIRRLHVFAKGMGLAAPQVEHRYCNRAAAIVIPPEPGADVLVLLNPEVVGESLLVDEQFEGCLSFFGVRGRVPRPRVIEVAYVGFDGTPKLAKFADGLARLVSHEIDHLRGRLYRSRMREGVEPIPYERYKAMDTGWNYGSD